MRVPREGERAAAERFRDNAFTACGGEVSPSGGEVVIFPHGGSLIAMQRWLWRRRTRSVHLPPFLSLSLGLGLGFVFFLDRDRIFLLCFPHTMAGFLSLRP